MTLTSERTVRCQVCGSTHLRSLYEGIRDHYGIAADEYRFLRCGECRSATLDPLPAPGALPCFYPAEYTFKIPEPGQPRLRRLLRSLEWRVFYRPVYRRRLRTFRRLTGLRSGLLLEVGCGSGLFLHQLSRAGYEVEGVEVSETEVAYARHRLGLSVFQGDLEILRLPSDRYDAVLLYYVLEHVLRPLDTVREAYRVVKPGGWIAAALPLIDSWQAQVLGPRWSQVTEAPRHLTLPSRLGARSLLTAAGFQTVRSAPMPLADNAGAIALSLLPGASTARSYGRSGSRSLVFRRCAGGLLLVPAFLSALAERLSWGADRRSGLTLFCAQK